jgi:hypothetical protein
MMKKLGIDMRIAIYGSQKEIEAAEKALIDNKVDLSVLDEPLARLSIQSVIDEYDLKASILFDGNSVWSKKRLVRDIRKVVKKGMNSMTDYLYKWLSLQAGSIAHYNKFGWIETYPTVDDLRHFILRNEFGRRVKEHINNRFADSCLIVSEIEQILKI